MFHGVNSPVITILVLVCLGIGVVIVIKVFGQVPAARARALLNHGAKLLDVRTPEEFKSGHLKGAVNVPYQEVGRQIAAIAPDKSAPVLVYCLSGGRSGVARSTLRRLDYVQAHNLGSLARARRIVES